MVRLFRVYYPVRTLVLLGGEALLVYLSFLLATRIQLGPDSYLVLNYENGFYKILAVTFAALLCSYYFDMYDPGSLSSESEVYFRLLLVVGILSLGLAGIGYLFPGFLIGRNVFLLGLAVLVVLLFSWRYAYAWLVRQPYMRERVVVLGSGERASRLAQDLRRRSDLGMDVVAFIPESGNGKASREELSKSLADLVKTRAVDRVIVAVSERRGTIPVSELLQMRLRGVRVEDQAVVLENITGKIEIDALHPSGLIFSDGFQLTPTNIFLRRLVSTAAALLLLIIVAPLIPLVILAIKLSSPGPVLYRQARVGRGDVIFHCYKFRTMRPDAEADTGATWASDDDPRITPLGRFLRHTRLDEIPQLWNVLKGEMGFVGPRPERPEFVEWLSREIPYYSLRHAIRPGITGWAQVCYKYGNSAEDAKEKLKYDLFYVKHASLALDLLIMFQTIKIVLLGRGAQ
jgi:sugar transferase (PEP-CTERM system associated)